MIEFEILIDEFFAIAALMNSLVNSWGYFLPTNKILTILENFSFPNAIAKPGTPGIKNLPYDATIAIDRKSVV